MRRKPEAGPWTAGLLAAALNLALFLLVTSLTERVELRAGLLIALVCAFSFLEAATQRDGGRAEPGATTDWASTLTGLSLFAVFGLGVLVPREPASGVMTVAGALTMVIGIALRVAAIRTLGRRFINAVAATPESALVTDGLYARARHPSELGILMITLGATVLTQSIAAGAAWLGLVLPLVVLRTRREDRLMTLVHGARYRAYAREVPRFLSVSLGRSPRV